MLKSHIILLQFDPREVYPQCIYGCFAFEAL